MATKKQPDGLVVKLFPGDLVTFRKSSFSGIEEYDGGSGIVIEVEVWKDKGAPDRNFGVNVYVLWSDGKYRTFEEDELELIRNEAR